MNDMIGYILVILLSMGGLITYTYNGLEYKGYPSISSCTGECYEEYKKREGTIAEQLAKKKAAAAGDPFSSVRGLWAGCAACHVLKAAGSEGNIGPNLDTVTMTVESVKEMVTYGLGVMPAFGEDEILTKEEIEIVSQYVVNVANK